MSRKKSKVVRYDGNTALEYQQDDAGMSLVGVRPLPSLPSPDISGLKDVDIVAFNREAERLFVSMLSQMIESQGAVPVRVVRSSLAFRLGVSVETIKRYLEKWTAPVEGAPFAIVDGSVVFSSHKRIEGKDSSHSSHSSHKRIEGKDSSHSSHSSHKRIEGKDSHRRVYIPRKRRKA